jgi:hypothetical protein
MSTTTFLDFSRMGISGTHTPMSPSACYLHLIATWLLEPPWVAKPIDLATLAITSEPQLRRISSGAGRKPEQCSAARTVGQVEIVDDGKRWNIVMNIGEQARLDYKSQVWWSFRSRCRYRPACSSRSYRLSALIWTNCLMKSPAVKGISSCSSFGVMQTFR